MMASRKGDIIRLAVDGKVFFNGKELVSKGLTGEQLHGKTIEPRSGVIEFTLTTTAEEMAAHEKAMAAWVWRLRWSEMWRIVGALAAIDLEFERALCRAGDIEMWQDPDDPTRVHFRLPSDGE